MPLESGVCGPLARYRVARVVTGFAPHCRPIQRDPCRFRSGGRWSGMFRREHGEFVDLRVLGQQFVGVFHQGRRDLAVEVGLPGRLVRERIEDTEGGLV